MNKTFKMSFLNWSQKTRNMADAYDSVPIIANSVVCSVLSFYNDRYKKRCAYFYKTRHNNVLNVLASNGFEIIHNKKRKNEMPNSAASNERA